MRFPQQPATIEVIFTVTRKDPDEPMTFQVSLKACFVVETETTPTSSVPITSSPYGSLTSGSISASGLTYSASASAVTPSVYSGSSSSGSSEYTGSISASGPSYTGSVSGSGTYSSPSTTPCNVVEGMDDPLYIPNRNIRYEDDEIPDRVQRLRPDSENPFSVNKGTVTLKVWFMPAVRISSFKVIKPENVESITVWYIKSTSRTSKSRPVVQVSRIYSINKKTYKITIV